MDLSVISQKLYEALLEHHSRVRINHEITDTQIDRHLITYGRLCEDAGLPASMAIGIGKFLGEIAEYCSTLDCPPINALAVNSESRMPGDNYDLAEGCSILQWPDQVKAVLLCHGYEAL